MALPPSRRTRFDHQTKSEHRATILLPNSVAVHKRPRHAVDGLSKIFKENNTVQNRPPRAEMAVTEFRVRCIQPLRHVFASPSVHSPRRLHTPLWALWGKLQLALPPSGRAEIPPNYVNYSPEIPLLVARNFRSRAALPGKPPAAINPPGIGGSNV